MTAEMALRVGRAAGRVFQTDDRPHTILIGKDTRQSGYMLENALTAGLCSVGVNVLLVGPLPTPGVSYIMRSLRADAAVMISASHNAYQDNGIKFFGRDGFKLDDEVEEEIERLALEDDTGEVPPEKIGRARRIQEAVGRYMVFGGKSRNENGNGDNDDGNVRPTGESIGRARRIDDAIGRYIEFAKATFPKGMRLDGLRIVCDCANGATYKVGPNTLTELGAEVIAIGNQPDGTNINKNCGSVHPELMRSTVIRERVDLGIAFDGDGDRIVMADEDGRLLDGNAILTILGMDMLERDKLPTKTIVTTIMANGGLERAITPLGGNVLHTKVGDRHVVEAMRKGGMLLGGESSGHIVMLEHNTTGDALLTALHVLATMIRKESRLSELAKAYEPMPEAHVNIPLNGKNRPTQEKLDKLKNKAEADLEGKGRIVIRPSGTEPLIRVMVQHETLGTAQELANDLADTIGGL